MEYKKIRDIIVYSDTGGDAIKTTPIVDYDTGIRCARVGDLANGREYRFWGYTEIIDKEFEKYKINEGDILITRTASLGLIYIARENLNGVYNNGLIRIIPNKEIVFPLYLYYMLKDMRFKNYIYRINGESSTRPNMKINYLLDYELILPNLYKQYKISRILSNLDSKIELNNRINDNLQKLILKIFINFISKNSTNEKLTLKDTVGKIGTGADAIQRAPIVDYDTKIKCIRIGDMTNNRTQYDWGFTKMEDKDFNNYRLEKGDIVITRTAVNGLTYLFDEDTKAVCNNGLIRLRVNKNYNPLYVYLLTKTKEFKDYIDRITGETSVRPNMKIEYLTSYPINYMSIDKQEEIVKIIMPMKNRQNEIKHENEILNKLRDTLLPKLMNGEIDLNKIGI